jgi:dihydroorotate dehydrogenase (fumarate)
MNLKTTYLGFPLRTPLVVSASPLSESIDNLVRMEDAGASAVVLPSVFEEQIRRERFEIERAAEQGTESYPEALTYLPDPVELGVGPSAYLRHVERAKQAVAVPIIASLNGSTPGGWVEFARQIEEAGADALELNLYSVPTDLELAGAAVEDRYVEVIRGVRAAVKIPLAVKLSPFLTNCANVAKRAIDAGAGGVVLFNPYCQPDIDLETMDIVPALSFSPPSALRLPLRWIAVLRGRLDASLAASGGVYSGTDAMKLLLAGADAVMLCSALMREGIDRIRGIEDEMKSWMEEHRYEWVEQLKGSMSLLRCPDPSAFVRAEYIRAVGVQKRA